MKRIIILASFLVITKTASPCNVCGGSSSSQTLGILPQTSTHFAGLQYQFRSFESSHKAHDVNEHDIHSNEMYQTMMVWGRYSISRRWQVFAFVPYHANFSKRDGIKEHVNGIGDITVIASAQIISKDDCGPKWKHNLQLGGGVKLPTGVYDYGSVSSEDGLPAMQPGTMSWDFTVNSNYSIRNDRIGANIDVSYTLTTPNSHFYKYGNRFTSTTLGFYTLNAKDVTLLPVAGIRYEYTGRDYDNYRLRWGNDMIGGSQLFSSIGVNGYRKSIGVMAIVHIPMYQHFADGLVKARLKAETGFQFLF